LRKKGGERGGDSRKFGVGGLTHYVVGDGSGRERNVGRKKGGGSKT